MSWETNNMIQQYIHLSVQTVLSVELVGSPPGAGAGTAMDLARQAAAEPAKTDSKTVTDVVRRSSDMIQQEAN